jgi:hypothetical protein
MGTMNIPHWVLQIAYRPWLVGLIIGFAFIGLVLLTSLLFEVHHMGVYLAEQRKRKAEPPWVRWYIEDDGRLTYKSEPPGTVFTIVGHLHYREGGQQIVDVLNRNRGAHEFK